MGLNPSIQTERKHFPLPRTDNLSYVKPVSAEFLPEHSSFEGKPRSLKDCHRKFIEKSLPFAVIISPRNKCMQSEIAKEVCQRRLALCQ